MRVRFSLPAPNFLFFNYLVLIQQLLKFRIKKDRSSSTMKLFQLILFSHLLIVTGLAKVHGPICQWYKNPTNSMAVHWVEQSVENSNNKYELSYCIANNDDWITAKISNSPFGDTKSKVYSVDLKNLKADAKYAFKISSGKKNLGKWFFKTAPL